MGAGLPGGMRAFPACMRCGSLELRSPKASEGGIGVAFFDRKLCRQCGWQGMPIEFEAEAEWREFVRAKWEDQAGIPACPQCGSRDVRLEGTVGACPHCQWRGDPVRFQDEGEWLAFAESRKNWRGRGGESG